MATSPGRSRRERARSVAALAASIGAGLVTWYAGYGCSVYSPSLLLSGAPDAATDHEVATTDAGPGDARPDVAEAGPGPCPETFVPGPPAQDDPSDAGDQTVIVAVHSIDVGLDDDAGAASFGYDLDDVYTCCDGGPESCKAAVTGATHCDAPGGRDNSAGQLLATLASIDSTQFNDSTINQRLEQGTYSILLQILHYNGRPNDTQVTVGLYASNGIGHDAGAKWNGQDKWTIDDSFVIAPDASTILPNHLDGNAYVTGGTLVVHVSFPISLGGSSTSTFSIDLTPGVLTGTLVPQDGTFALRGGEMAGRWSVSNLLGAVQNLMVMGSTICPGSTTYDFVKGEVCQYADIMTDPTLDGTGATCDGLSLGIGFTADPAVFGKVVPTPMPKVLCPGDGSPDNCQ